MKVAWLFPPTEEGGFPNISQYRFFKRMPIRVSIIYPYLAASGATQLRDSRHHVRFLDAPTMNLDVDQVMDTVGQSDVVVMEARTPTIQYIWEWCNRIRELHPHTRIVLYGDHVSWNPEESLPFAHYIVCGGDYDVGVTRLVNYLERGVRPPRIYQPPLCDSLDTLPFVDRELVDWRIYYEAWRHRDLFFWTMSARGCWYSCTFCAWVETFWKKAIRFRSVKNVVGEYLILYDKYGELELLDDADIFVTQWGVKFARELISQGLDNKEVIWAYQTHPNEIYGLENFRVMRQAGLRTVKLGIESLNQHTLNYIQKGTTIQQIEKAIKLLKSADIMVHANLMVGFPWETRRDAEHTIDLIKKLNPNQAQFSLVIPYPNTRLYEDAKDNRWLLVKEGEWNQFDASHPMLSMEGLTPEEVVQLYKDHWSQFYFNPRYIWNHVKSIRHWEAIKQLWRGYRSVRYGHMRAVE